MQIYALIKYLVLAEVAPWLVIFALGAALVWWATRR